MSKCLFHTLFTGIIVCMLFSSCQKDNYEESELKPKTYSFNIPNKIGFNFSQLSENRESIVPYSNSLVLKNISNVNLSGKYAIFAFKDASQNFGNLAFIKHANFSEIITNTVSDTLNLEASDNLFTDDNLIACILSFDNAASDHNLNGFYTGELNIFSPAADNSSEPTFVRSMTCTGFIDFEGRFHFLIHNSSEDNVVQLKGNFNASNQVTGNILNRDANNLSAILNNGDVPFMLNENNLTGDFLFTENSDARILKFNLTKQN